MLPSTSTLFPYTRSSDLVHRVQKRQEEPLVGRQEAVVPGHRERRPDAGVLPQDVVGLVLERAHLVGRRSLPADRKSTRLNSSHITISYAVFCLKKKT